MTEPISVLQGEKRRELQSELKGLLIVVGTGSLFIPDVTTGSEALTDSSPVTNNV